jgi:hypothetical protein
MPLFLHPHLKRDLAFDDYDVHPDDVVERLPPANIDPEQQSAKRRRIERIAAQCLQGNPPVLIAAGLRGPFNDGWKNPWAGVKKTKRKSAERAGSVVNKPADARGTDIGPRVEPTKARRLTRSGSRKTLETLETQASIASPEASRAATYDMDDFNDSHTLEEVEVPPATAPSPNEHVSPATGFFGVGTEKCVQSRSSLTNPFWLRRPESGKKFDRRRTTNNNTPSSPTRPRSAQQRAGSKKPLQLPVPPMAMGVRAPLAGRLSPDTRSSASAPMAISSPAKPTALGSETVVYPSAMAKQTPVAAAVHVLDDASELQAAQLRSVAIAQAVSPATGIVDILQKPAPVLEPPVTVSKDDSPRRSSQNGSQKRPAREEVQHLAERLANSQPKPSMINSEREGGSQPAKQKHLGPRTSQHGLVASPDPNSSTGFVYKKVGGAKWTIGNAPRSKPRAVNFNSSPVVKEAKASSKPNSEEVDSVLECAVLDKSPVEGQELEGGGSQGGGPTQEQQSLRSSRSSRQSAMSTQAAMLLAQLEFQESTYPTSSVRTSRPWSQSQETPRSAIPELSPAITPLSVFRPELAQPQQLASAFRGPPMSTQDLFAAASPFAFSTVKKRADAPQLSNLRIAIMPLDGHVERNADASPRSPPSSPDRIPLKDKSVAPSPWSFTFEKGPQGSQGSMRGNARPSLHDIEIPHHESYAALDEYGLNGSLNFTERLLHNLDT